jgi:hypothetical protein
VVTGTSGVIDLTLAVGGRSPVVEEAGVGLVPAERNLAVALGTSARSAEVGDVVRYRVVVSDEGTVPEDGAVVVLEAPQGTVVAAARGEGWTCDVDGRTARCSLERLVRPGEELPELLVDVRVTGAVSGQVGVRVTSLDGRLDVAPGDDAARVALVVAAPADPAEPPQRPDPADPADPGDVDRDRDDRGSGGDRGDGDDGRPGREGSPALPAGRGSGGSGGSEGLAFTGADLPTLLALGGALVAAGFVALRLARRRPV